MFPRLLYAIILALLWSFPATAGYVTPSSTPSAIVPPAPIYEFRAAWLSPVGGGGNGDWPSRPGLPAESQKAELRALLDRAQAMGLNAVIMHVRTAADALYPSPYAPWSAFLTGVSGQDPGYDPLKFAIDEAHARGLQLHAWFNPYRAVLGNLGGRAAPEHVTVAHPDWIRKYGSQTWIDPGEPRARDDILASILDVVKRYDVDGIHIDDYFYPYRESERVTKRVGKRKVTTTHDIPFPDDVTWEKYGAGEGWTNRNDWRRNNVNEFVRTLYYGVKQEKPWVVVGISPFGIWRSGVPAGITGLDAYAEIYADARLWLREGWADYFAPQLYWAINGVQGRFSVLDSWWREPAQNPHGRHIWPGLATMHLATSYKWSTDEIVDQIQLLRNTRANSTDVPGHVHFRISSLRRNDWAAADDLHERSYREPALVPAFPWLNQALPPAPIVEAPELLHAPRHIVVAPTKGIVVAWWLVQTYDQSGVWTSNLYRSDGNSTVIPLDGIRIVAVAVRGINRAGQSGEVTIYQW